MGNEIMIFHHVMNDLKGFQIWLLLTFAFYRLPQRYTGINLKLFICFIFCRFFGNLWIHNNNCKDTIKKGFIFQFFEKTTNFYAAPASSGIDHPSVTPNSWTHLGLSGTHGYLVSPKTLSLFTLFPFQLS